MQLRFIYLLSTGVTSNAIGGCANVVESHVSIQTSNGETVGCGVVLDRDDALIMLCIKYSRHFHLSDLVSLCGVGSQIPRNHLSVCIAGEYLGRLLNVDSYIHKYHIPAGGDGRGAQRDPTHGLGGDAGGRGLDTVAANLWDQMGEGIRVRLRPTRWSRRSCCCRRTGGS